MTAATAGTGPHADPNHVGHDEENDWAGPAPREIITSYGFWIFLLSDIIMFASFFAGYAVLAQKTASGPGAADVFDLRNVAIQTICLLLSTFACAMAGVATERRRIGWTQWWLLVTGLLGAVFLLLEVREFTHMIAEGAGPSRSAFLSGFFILVGCHGVHVSLGLLWLCTSMAQLQVRGFKPYILRRMQCFNLFWHTLDVVWVGLFSIVYLWGSVA